MKVNDIDTLKKIQTEFNRVINEHIDAHSYNETIRNISNLNLGELKKLYESISVQLLESENGRKIMRNYISLIKENTDLKKMFELYNYIDNININCDYDKYLYESVSCTKGINKKEFTKNLKKLSNIISEGVKLCKLSKNDIENCVNATNKIYENIDFIVFNKKNLKNLNEHIEKEKNIISYIENHYKCINENEYHNISNKEIIQNLNNEINENDEQYLKKLIEDITIYNLSNNDLSLLFEDYKNECIETIDSILLTETEIEKKTKMLNMKNNLSDKLYCENTFYNDIINLSELKTTLKDIIQNEN